MDDRIKSAIDALDSQKGLSVRAAATKYGVNRTTLGRRYNGESQSRAAATSMHHQNLTNVEEDTLISYINNLTDRHIPPTPQIVQNLAEELILRPVDKN
jgi:transposase-like protein